MRKSEKDLRASDQVIGSAKVIVDAGICGFSCQIQAHRDGPNSVRVELRSECEHIQHLATLLNDAITLKDLFSPLSRNRIYTSTERAGCHLSCPIPAGVIKACEVAMDMALPKDVAIRIEKDV